MHWQPPLQIRSALDARCAKIKVKEGKIYFPKALNKVYPDNQKLVAWFYKGKYSLSMDIFMLFKTLYLAF